jgi:hypothetical protein
MRKALADFDDEGTHSKPLRENFVADLNRIIRGPSIYEPGRFADVPLRPITRFLLGRPASGIRQIRLNRLLIEDAYPRELARFKPAPERMIWGGISLRTEAALALAAIVPQDPEVIASLLEDLDPARSDVGEPVAELIRHSTAARNIFDQAVKLAGINTKTNLVLALSQAPAESRHKAAVLSALLAERDDCIKYAAVQLLGEMGAAASEAVPALTKLLGLTMDEQKTSGEKTRATQDDASPVQFPERVEVSYGDPTGLAMASAKGSMPVP